MHAYLLGGRPIHFPFPSGLLDYECETCDAPCCRGAELGIGRSRELVTLERVLPRASLFARPGFAGGSMLSVSSPLEACWFLDRKDRCRLHKVGGPEAKPAGCRLFPFHRVRSLGEAVVVLPDFTCPLAVCPPDRSSPRSLHDELALEMHRAGVPRGGHKALPPPQDMDWEQALLLERRVVLATPHHLDDTDYLPYCDVQQALALEALGLDGARATLAPVRQSMERLLGSCARPSPGLVRELVALTGILRLCVSTVARREVPALLLALSVLLGEYEQMRGMRRSPRTAVSLLEEHLPLLYVLAHLRDRPVLKDHSLAMEIAASTPGARSTLLLVLERLAENEDLTVAHPLEEILRDHDEVFEPPLTADAVAVLYGIGKALLRTGAFVPL